MSEAAVAQPLEQQERSVGLWGDALRRMRRSPSAIIGGAMNKWTHRPGRPDWEK